jgi:hypothetical protein
MRKPHPRSGTGRQPEPRTLDEPGLASVLRSPAVSGHPAGSPAVPESVLEPRRYQGIPAGFLPTLRRDSRPASPSE